MRFTTSAFMSALLFSLILVLVILLSGCAVPPSGINGLPSGGAGGGSGAGLPKLWDVASYKRGGGFVGVVGDGPTFMVMYPKSYTDYSTELASALPGFSATSLDFYTDTNLFMVLYNPDERRGAIANVSIGANLQVKSTESDGGDRIYIFDYQNNPVSLDGVQPKKVRVLLSGGSISYAAAVGDNGSNSYLAIANTATPSTWVVPYIDGLGGVTIPGVATDIDWVASGGGNPKIVVVTLDGKVEILTLINLYDLKLEKNFTLDANLYGVGSNLDPSGQNLQFPVVVVGQRFVAVITPSGESDYTITGNLLENVDEPDLANALFYDVTVTGDTAILVGYNPITDEPIAAKLNVSTNEIQVLKNFQPMPANMYCTAVTFLPTNVQYIWTTLTSISQNIGRIYYSDDSGSTFKEY